MIMVRTAPKVRPNMIVRAIETQNASWIRGISPRTVVTAALFYSLIESAKLCRVEPRAYLREATLRAVRNAGTVTLARELK